MTFERIECIEQADGSKWYCKNGKFHRENGPAIEWADGSKEWFFYGYEALSEEEFYSDEFRKEVYEKIHQTYHQE